MWNLMTNPSPLFSRTAIKNGRRRVKSDGLFLHQIAAEEIQEKLQDINRAFTKKAVVTGHKDFWAEKFPDAVVVNDEDYLDFQEQSFDLVIHAMALHCANDPVGQLIQARRALRSDGFLLAVALGGQTLFELRDAFRNAETRVLGGIAPRVLPMGDIRDLGALLGRAGFALPVADKFSVPVRYGSALALLKDLRAMGETNCLNERPKTFSTRTLFAALEDEYRKMYAEGDHIIATYELVFLTGWVPDPSQQQPLRPGSAQIHLSDVLPPRELGKDEK